MDATTHLSNILDALNTYNRSNKRPAIDEPANDFETAVVAHNHLANLIDEVKKALKPVELEERTLRDGIAKSLDVHFGTTLAEGVNSYVLSNMRKLKYTRKVERKIEMSMVAVARNKFDTAADKVGAFDDVLRVKYELDAKAWKKLVTGGEAFKACSEMIVAKPAAPVLEVD